MPSELVIHYIRRKTWRQRRKPKNLELNANGAEDAWHLRNSMGPMMFSSVGVVWFAEIFLIRWFFCIGSAGTPISKFRKRKIKFYPWLRNTWVPSRGQYPQNLLKFFKGVRPKRDVAIQNLRYALKQVCICFANLPQDGRSLSGQCGFWRSKKRYPCPRALLGGMEGGGQGKRNDIQPQEPKKGAAFYVRPFLWGKSLIRSPALSNAFKMCIRLCIPNIFP